MSPAAGVRLSASSRATRASGRPTAIATRSFLDQFRGGHDPLTLESQLRRNRIYVSALVPRDAGDEVGWFDAGLFGTEDHDLWIRILETGRRAVLNPKALAVYRHVPGSVSSDLARQATNDQETYRRAVARGRLSPEQRRIAEREIRYHEVRGAVAEAWFARRPAALVRRLPAAAGVVLRNPDRWRDWAHALSGGRR